jgi:ankyrin repeat protein
MPSLYDVAHFCSWNGYSEDTRNYLGIDKAAWTNKEFWFPFGANLGYGPKKKTRIQRICEEMGDGYDGKNYYRHCMMRSYDPVARVQQLLADGAKPDIKDTEGWSGLLVCSRNGWPDHHKIVKLLLDAGADLNQKTEEHALTPLILAANNGHLLIVRELILHGADVNISNSYGPPIAYASNNGHLEIVKELVKAGAGIDDGIFKAAISGGQVSVLKYLMTLAQVPQDAVKVAVVNKQANIIRTLAKAGADMNFGCPIHMAARSDAHDCLLALCAGGADLNVRDDDNDTPITLAILVGNYKAIKILADYKANLNIMTNDTTALHYAIMMYSIFPADKEKRKECVLAMIEAGPNFNLLDEVGNTPAQDAEERKMPDIVTLIKRAELKQRSLKSKAKR